MAKHWAHDTEEISGARHEGCVLPRMNLELIRAPFPGLPRGSRELMNLPSFVESPRCWSVPHLRSHVIRGYLGQNIAGIFNEYHVSIVAQG